MRSAGGAALMLGTYFCKMVYIFGIIMEKYESSKMAKNFGQDLGLQNGKKTPKKCPLYNFFATQEAVLGESIFGGANGLQILKFILFQKVDSISFPISYPTPVLDCGTPSKIGLEKALHIGSMALRIG